MYITYNIFVKLNVLLFTSSRIETLKKVQPKNSQKMTFWWNFPTNMGGGALAPLLEDLGEVECRYMDMMELALFCKKVSLLSNAEKN